MRWVRCSIALLLALLASLFTASAASAAPVTAPGGPWSAPTSPGGYLSWDDPMVDGTTYTVVVRGRSSGQYQADLALRSFCGPTQGATGTGSIWVGPGQSTTLTVALPCSTSASLAILVDGTQRATWALPAPAPTATATPTSTPTATATATATPTASPTATATTSPTSTPAPTGTATASPTSSSPATSPPPTSGSSTPPAIGSTVLIDATQLNLLLGFMAALVFTNSAVLFAQLRAR